MSCNIVTQIFVGIPTLRADIIDVIYNIVKFSFAISSLGVTKSDDRNSDD